MAYLLYHNCIIFNIEQNPVITHAKTIAEVGLSQPLDVAGKSIFQASYFSDDLALAGAEGSRQPATRTRHEIALNSSVRRGSTSTLARVSKRSQR